MTDPTRIDTAQRHINASDESIYTALIDPDAWIVWLPPDGMTGEISRFDAREGGSYELTLTYTEPGQGKSTADTDITRGIFEELVPNKRMVQLVEFASDQEEFAGTMRMSWVITSESDGCLVTILAENVPPGISPEDHAVGMRSTLRNLGTHCEHPAKS